MKLKIRELINESGMTKRFVANKLEVNENTLGNWMDGRSMPKLDQAVKLADILNCDVNDLYIRSDA